MKCYLAGPMRGLPNLNFAAFHEAADVLRHMGFTVISPAQNDIDAGEPWTSKLDPNWANVDYPFSPEDCRRMVRRDLDLILSLDASTGDCIVVLDGWRDSVGAFGECAVGKWVMLPISHLWKRDGAWWITRLHEPGTDLCIFPKGSTS